MKLRLVLISIKKNQLEFGFQNKAINIIKAAFTDAFEYNKAIDIDVDIDVDIVDGSSKGIDFAIAFDQAPPVPNANFKLQRLVSIVGKELKSIIPDNLPFEGRGTFVSMSGLKENNLSNASSQVTDDENEFEQLAKQYTAEKPKFKFSQIVLAEDVRREIDEALVVLTHREMLFDAWGLRTITSPSVLLNLYGASGTGKTMAAEAIADRMGKNIIKATYADIESKWHGEGPQKLKAIFLAAGNQDAVLFIDEADSMLSSRLSGVSNGSEQAINSMRSQLLICLENFDGVVIFATNLITNYDPAFLTRLICIEMKKPDKVARKQIWHNHLYPTEGTEVQLNIPSAGDWDLDELAEKYEFVGRDIRNAVKKACISAVASGKDCVGQEDLIYACEATKKQNDNLQLARNNKVKKLSPAEEENVTQQIANAIIKKKQFSQAD